MTPDPPVMSSFSVELIYQDCLIDYKTNYNPYLIPFGRSLINHAFKKFDWLFTFVINALVHKLFC